MGWVHFSKCSYRRIKDFPDNARLPDIQRDNSDYRLPCCSENFEGKKIGLLTPYVGEVNSLIQRYFEAHEYCITKSITFSEIDDNRAGKITPASISDAVVDQFSKRTLTSYLSLVQALERLNLSQY